VRELKNVVERAVYRSEDNTIQQIEFDPFKNTVPATKILHPAQEQKTAESKSVSLGIPLLAAVRNLEVSMLKAALAQTRHNQKQAASLLGLTYHQLRGYYRKYQQQL
jgi:psp operon transcriptional activator